MEHGILPSLLGRRVRVWRGDLNYPVGDYLVGLVRNYSLVMKKWLVTYDHNGGGGGGKGGVRHGASWINFAAKDCTFTVLDHRKDKGGSSG